MMVAMMYPSSVPLFRLYAETLEGTTAAGKATRVGAFIGTYALVWTLTGVVPLVVNALVPIVGLANAHSGLLMGGSLLLLSGYQLTTIQISVSAVLSVTARVPSGPVPAGVRGAVRMSWQFSVFCVGCCWALFAFMVIVGSMNIVWMALIAVVLSLERTVTWGEQLARGVGILAGIGGSVVIVLSLV